MRDPRGVALIVHACAYLHNMAIDEGLVPLTRVTQRDPDFEHLLRQNAVVFMLNSVKRNAHRKFKAHYRRQKESVYVRGLEKRNQILREQFGERGVKIGRVSKRPVGRPRGSTSSRRQNTAASAPNRSEPQPGPSTR